MRGVAASPIALMDDAVRTGRLPAFAQMQSAIARSLYDLRRAAPYRLWGEPLRGRYSWRYGYGIPCREVIQELVTLSPLLEVGAGNGFWTYWLRKAGADVVAVDAAVPDPYTRNPWIQDLVLADGADAVREHPDRNVLMVWPRYDTLWPTRAIHALRDTQLLSYVGEGPFGAAAHPSAFVALEARGFVLTRLLSVPNWPMSSGYLAIYAKHGRDR